MSVRAGVDVATADEMRALGERLGQSCRPGDVVLLVGDLGAGKTTLTQGIAAGVGISDAITSPTFVIARSHRHPSGGPHLVHVDAYRLAGSVELDDLDLESDLATSVVVVEWGEGIADGLADDRLGVRIERRDEEDDLRHVSFEPHGERWASVVAGLS